MHFPVSGIECSPLLPPLVGFVVASLTTSAGISGAFLLIPFQMSVLGYVTPGVAPTNLIYNTVAIPGGVYRYLREGRMLWPMALTILLGTLPGMFLGAFIRVRYLPQPRSAKLAVGLVLLYLGGRILYGVLRGPAHPLDRKFRELGRLPPGAKVAVRRITWRQIDYTFWNETYSFRPATVISLALIIGLIGGIYGIGGGAIIAPFLVAIFHLPVYTLAAATLFATFGTSIAGIAFFELLSATSLGDGVAARPDWLLGALFGLGGLAGTSVGARLQKYLPESRIRLLVAALALSTGAAYLVQSALSRP